MSGFAAEASATFAKKCLNKGATKARYQNIKEAKAELFPLGFTDFEFIQWACVPDTDSSRDAFMWLTKFFEMVGDNAPNRECKVQVPGIYTLDSIFQMYELQMKSLYTGNEHEPLAQRAFEELWHNIFPHCSISKYCQVSGKCHSCASLYERQEVFYCEADLRKIRKLASIHKIMIEMQRAAYIRNRQLAQENPDLYMSVIIDGMAQDHRILPYYAGKHAILLLIIIVHKIEIELCNIQVSILKPVLTSSRK